MRNMNDINCVDTLNFTYSVLSASSYDKDKAEVKRQFEDVKKEIIYLEDEFKTKFDKMSMDISNISTSTFYSNYPQGYHIGIDSHSCNYIDMPISKLILYIEFVGKNTFGYPDIIREEVDLNINTYGEQCSVSTFEYEINENCVLIAVQAMVGGVLCERYCLYNKSEKTIKCINDFIKKISDGLDILGKILCKNVPKRFIEKAELSSKKASRIVQYAIDGSNCVTKIHSEERGR